MSVVRLTEGQLQTIDLLTSFGRDNEIPVQVKDGNQVVVELPGVHKLKTIALFSVTPGHTRIEAFVCRCPDEAFLCVYRYLLLRNRRLHGVAYTLDNAGDIYLVGSVPTGALDAAYVDLLFGQILDAADSDFNPIVELGFETSIRKEWEWRKARGESLRNLEPFLPMLEGGKARGAEPESWVRGEAERAAGAGAPPSVAARVELRSDGA